MGAIFSFFILSQIRHNEQTQLGPTRHQGDSMCEVSEFWHDGVEEAEDAT